MTHIVKEIHIYPIKSLGGISLQQAKALEAGFEHDRRWMLIDKEGKFMTQRNIPKMALFGTKLSGDSLVVTFENESMSVDVHQSSHVDVRTQVWDDTATTVEVNTETSQWFSHILGQTVRLVKIKDESSRMHHSSILNKNIAVSLADGYPYLLVGEQSLRTLNDQLISPISMDRFRPNIVVTSHIAHEEDNLSTLVVGSATFENIKPCGRCQVITINQQTAIAHNEPLKVLSTYRKVGNSVLFGTNMRCTQQGIVTVGDVLR